MAEEIEGKGFVIRDRRASAKTDEEIAEEAGQRRESKKAAEATQARDRGPASADAEGGAQQLPLLDFSSFILSLSSSAMIHFGEIPDPMSGRKQKNLAAARQTIDIIGMLQEKTRGNLEEHEQRLVDNVLYELKMRYVRELEQKG